MTRRNLPYSRFGWLRMVFSELGGDTAPASTTIGAANLYHALAMNADELGRIAAATVVLFALRRHGLQ